MNNLQRKILFLNFLQQKNNKNETKSIFQVNIDFNEKL